MGSRIDPDFSVVTSKASANNRMSQEDNRQNRSKPVISIHLRTGLKVQRYASQAKAAAALGIDQSALSKCCRGKIHSAGGFSWQFENEGDDEEDKEGDGDSDVQVVKTNSAVIKSKKANMHGVGDQDLIAARLREYNRKKESKGQKQNGRPTPVYSINLTTGLIVKRYSSQKKAAAAMGISFVC
jgi:predicted XRE-type DNA-binding protein